ncbi:MAG: hypothetical protein NTU84_00025 [Verrucomicrobia bacterium]|nr:hypothetical protein [Verrucomicrobiota bacterium]
MIPSQFRLHGGMNLAGICKHLGGALEPPTGFSFACTGSRHIERMDKLTGVSTHRNHGQGITHLLGRQRRLNRHAWHAARSEQPPGHGELP